MTDIANDMRRLDEWMREQNLDMQVPDYVKSSPYDAAEEIERLEGINKELLEAIAAIAKARGEG